MVYGDSAYGSSGEFLDHLAGARIESRCKTQPPTAAGGMLTKDRFAIDLQAGTVTCPNGATATIRRDKHGDGTASFGAACGGCPLRGSPSRSSPASTSGDRLLREARRAFGGRSSSLTWSARIRKTSPTRL